ncbi:WD repeat-containing protein 53 [Phlyctochytrium planicorne]|nr:WD repeat-containing protein 53 [Phlyctochytrium planicorne]
MLKGHREAVTALKANADAKVLLSGSEDATARLWDLETKKCRNGIRFTSPISSVGLVESAVFVASGQKIFAFDSRTLPLMADESSSIYSLGPLPDEINMLSINDQSEFLATADDHGLVHVFDLKGRKMYKKLRPVHENLCTAVTFRPKRRWEVWSGGMDYNVVKWDFSRGSPSDVFKITNDTTSDKVVNPPFVLSLSFSLDGNNLFAGLGDGRIGIFSLQDSRQELSMTTSVEAYSWSVSTLQPTKPLSSSATGPISQPLVSGGLDGSLCIWEAAETKEKGLLERFRTITGRKINCVETIISDKVRIYYGGCERIGNVHGLIDVVELSNAEE